MKKQKRTSQEKGITLVALIITIIVLLILAVVAIRAVSNDGIISHAKNAQTRYEQEQAKEQAMLESYLGALEADKVATTMEEAQSNTMLSKTKNSEITDKYGNKIVVPAGFKILVDSTTDYTKEDIDVTKGIVIQDANGNEFVWITVGDVYTTEDTEKNSSNTTTITLGRYSWSESTPTLVQPTESNPYTSEVEITSGSYNFTELQPIANGKGPKGNAIAKNINNFYEKAIASQGYYIGRYEAGKENNTLVCKANKTVYNNVTQPKASALSQNMYTNKPYESDLINSYAWDTAIVFIQTFAKEDYASYNKSKETLKFQKTGENGDKYCNINDMSGNALEWTTETSSNSNYPCTNRGGCYDTDFAEAYSVTSACGVDGTTFSLSCYSFRPLLYV